MVSSMSWSSARCNKPMLGMVAQIWQAVQCILKSKFALEHKLFIINFDMDLMRKNLNKVCDLFALIHPPSIWSLVNPFGSTCNLPPISHIVLVNSHANGAHTLATKEVHHTHVPAPIGSKFESIYHTPPPNHVDM